MLPIRSTSRTGEQPLSSTSNFFSSPLLLKSTELCSGSRGDLAAAACWRICPSLKDPEVTLLIQPSSQGGVGESEDHGAPARELQQKAQWFREKVCILIPADDGSVPIVDTWRATVRSDSRKGRLVWRCGQAGGPTVLSQTEEHACWHCGFLQRLRKNISRELRNEKELHSAHCVLGSSRLFIRYGTQAGAGPAEWDRWSRSSVAILPSGDRSEGMCTVLSDDRQGPKEESGMDRPSSRD